MANLTGVNEVSPAFIGKIHGDGCLTGEQTPENCTEYFYLSSYQYKSISTAIFRLAFPQAAQPPFTKGQKTDNISLLKG
ncbi:MAG: hypothetical protein HY796_08220 [Elusimicrobia bacterium]|nr:hypothetical protein [Elusimicrobiota bacterium]